MKKITSWILSVIMVLTVFSIPTGVWADEGSNDEEYEPKTENAGQYLTWFENPNDRELIPGARISEKLNVKYIEDDNPDYDPKADKEHYYYDKENDKLYLRDSCVSVKFSIENVTGDIIPERDVDCVGIDVEDEIYEDEDEYREDKDIDDDEGYYVTHNNRMMDLDVSDDCPDGSFDVCATIRDKATGEYIGLTLFNVTVRSMYKLKLGRPDNQPDYNDYVPGEKQYYTAKLVKAQADGEEEVIDNDEDLQIQWDFGDSGSANEAFTINREEGNSLWSVAATSDDIRNLLTEDWPDYPLSYEVRVTASLNGENVAIKYLYLNLCPNVYRIIPKKNVTKYLGSKIKASDLVTIKYFDAKNLKGLTRSQYLKKGYSLKQSPFGLKPGAIYYIFSDQSSSPRYLKFSNYGFSAKVKSEGMFYLATPKKAKFHLLAGWFTRNYMIDEAETDITINIACKHKTLKTYSVKPATYTTEGRAKYYECKTCHQLFTDKYKKHPFTDKAQLTIPAISESSVSLVNADNYAYNGKAKKPHAYAEDVNGKVLTEGKDYTISYKNNVNASTSELLASATVKFQGKYSGSKKFYFAIDKAQQKLQASAPARLAKGKTETLKITGAKGRISVASAQGNVSVKLVKGVYKIKGKAAGTDTITVKAAGTSNYYPAETNKEIEVY